MKKLIVIILLLSGCSTQRDDTQDRYINALAKAHNVLAAKVEKLSVTPTPEVRSGK